MKPIIPYCFWIIFEVILLIDFNSCLQSETSESLMISFKDNYRKLNSEFDSLVQYSKNISELLDNKDLHIQRDSVIVASTNENTNTSINDSTDNPNSISHPRLMEIKQITEQATASIANLQNYHKTFINEFEEFESLLKKRNLKKVKSKYQKNVLFYNSISLIMLCLLAGGLVGVIFILYYSFSIKEGKSEEV